MKYLMILAALLLTSCINAYPKPGPYSATVYTYHKWSAIEGYHVDSRIVSINGKKIGQVSPFETYASLRPGQNTLVITTRFRPTPTLFTQTKDANVTLSIFAEPGQQYFYMVRIDENSVQGWLEDYTGRRVTEPAVAEIFVPKLRSPKKEDFKELVPH